MAAHEPTERTALTSLPPKLAPGPDAGVGTSADRPEVTNKEARGLGEEALIHITGFFRDPEVFDALRTTVFPALLEHREPSSCLRVWVVGCSTGEEVYSLAISLLEHLAAHGSQVPVKIFGTDVSARAIARARAGRYPASIESEVSTERLQRFFVSSGNGWKIATEVRDLCVFAVQDVTRDPPFSGIDLMSCLNLMSDHGAALQERVLPLLHSALKIPGFLMLGSAETTGSFPGFSAIDAKNRIFKRSNDLPRQVFTFRPSLARPLAGPSPAAGYRDVQREADRIVLAKLAPPGVVVTDDLAIVRLRGRTGHLLELAPGVARFDLLHILREELRIPVRQTIDDVRKSRGEAR